jgi:hypoxanthine phosphoribosyltransferase
MWFLIVICILHFLYINPLEKIYFSYNLNDTNRPLEKCIDKKYNWCNGFPSGHAEITTILCGYLLYSKLISVPVAVLLIILVCSQRLITHMHTFKQVSYGVYIGIIYSYLYWSTNYSLYSLLIAISCALIYLLIIYNIIEKYLDEPIPKWVDPVMYDKMNEKKNTNVFVKLSTLYVCITRYDWTSFRHWNEIEHMLDKAIDKIKESNIKYDAIIGIKSGGAIVSDYISKKLNIENYKIKVSNKKMKVNDDFTALNRKIYHKEEYAVDEDGVSEKVKNKNIIIIDECTFTGVTMDVAIKYFEPIVDNIYPIVLNGTGFTLSNVKKVEVIDTNFISVWPWGYDN